MAAIRSDELLVDQRPPLKLIDVNTHRDRSRWHPSMGPDALRSVDRGETHRADSPNYALRRSLVALVGSIVLVTAGWAATAASASSASAPRELYTVNAGDTLWSISNTRRPNADPRKTVGQIRSINGVGPEISPGQVLELP